MPSIRFGRPYELFSLVFADFEMSLDLVGTIPPWLSSCKPLLFSRSLNRTRTIDSVTIRSVWRSRPDIFKQVIKQKSSLSFCRENLLGTLQYYSSSRVRAGGGLTQDMEPCTGGRLSGIRARCTMKRKISIPTAFAAWPILSHSLSGAMIARCLQVLLRSKFPGKREVKAQHTGPDNGNKKKIIPT